jgi:hypothetical protein
VPEYGGVGGENKLSASTKDWVLLMVSILNVVLWFRMMLRKQVNIPDKYGIYSQPLIFLSTCINLFGLLNDVSTSGHIVSNVKKISEILVDRSSHGFS